MSVAALRSRFSTHQSENFDATRRDAGLSAPRGDACRSWTAGPRRDLRVCLGTKIPRVAAMC